MKQKMIELESKYFLLFVRVMHERLNLLINENVLASSLVNIERCPKKVEYFKLINKTRGKKNAHRSTKQTQLVAVKRKYD